MLQPKITRVPGQFPTIRASNIFVYFDGGSFGLSLQDMRPAENHDAAAPITHYASVEVGRFTISPATLMLLEQSLGQAKKAYETAMGHTIPDPSKIGDALNADAAIKSLLPQPQPPSSEPS